MKLIRLTTEDENANFDSYFNEDIIIGENSQIALQSLSVESEYQEIEINGTNDNIFYNLRGTTAGSVNRRVVLNHTGTGVGQEKNYNSNNYQVLFTDIETKLNQGLQSDLGAGNTITTGGVEIGTQWKCSVSKNAPNTGKVVVEARQSNLSSRYTSFDANIPTRTLSTGAEGLVLAHTAATENAIWNKTENEPAGNNNTFLSYFEHSLTKGCGVWRARINTWIDDGTEANLESGGVIGVTKLQIGSFIKERDLLNSEITYGIHADKVAGTYKVIKAGVRSDSGVSPVYGAAGSTRPIIEIVIELGRIKGKLYQDNGAGGVVKTILFDEVYDNITPLYPFMCFRGKYTAGVRGLRFTQLRLTSDPYYDIELTDNHYPNTTHIDNLGAVTPPAQNTVPTSCFLEFIGESLTQFLGIGQLRNPSAGFNVVRDFSVIGNTNFKATDLSDAFLVLMDSVKLKSYDDYDTQGNKKGSRRDILSVVPQSDSGGVMLYEPNNHLWLDVDNFEPMYLRNIRARVVKSDYSPLLTNGLTSLVILVRNKNEM